VAFVIVLVIAVGDYFVDGKKRFKRPRLPRIEAEDPETLQEVGMFEGKSTAEVRTV